MGGRKSNHVKEPPSVRWPFEAGAREGRAKLLAACGLPCGAQFTPQAAD